MSSSWKLRTNVASTPKFMKKIPLNSSRKMMEQITEAKTRGLANGRIRAYADRTVNERTQVTQNQLGIASMGEACGVN